MAEISFRPFADEDPSRVVKWYQEDREGFSAFMGKDIPDEFACTLAMNTILQGDVEGRGVFRMADCGDETVGFVGLSNVTPDRKYGQPHLYVAKKQRRHSFRVGRAAEKLAKELGLRHFMITVEYDNRRGLSFAKRMGYEEIRRKSFMKELE
jgi:RimJ/RimL family protein N-acetyltransferase